MASFIFWTACALGMLFVVGCVVAWWEHLGRARQPQGEIDWESPVPKTVQVDVALDALTAPGRDVGERRKALGGALTRMADRRSGSGLQAWVDTAPMILPGGTGQGVTADQRQLDAAETQQ